MILGHWRKQKTPKAPGNIGENIEENHGNGGKQDKRQQDPETLVVLETSSLLLLPERACAQKGGVELVAIAQVSMKSVLPLFTPSIHIQVWIKWKNHCSKRKHIHLLLLYWKHREMHLPIARRLPSPLFKPEWHGQWFSEIKVLPFVSQSSLSWFHGTETSTTSLEETGFL